jgi:hypothetical protein
LEENPIGSRDGHPSCPGLIQAKDRLASLESHPMAQLKRRSLLVLNGQFLRVNLL